MAAVLEIICVNQSESKQAENPGFWLGDVNDFYQTEIICVNQSESKQAENLRF